MKTSFCVACGDIDRSRLEHHHLVPRSEGGGDEDSNLITLCFLCHGKLHGCNRRHAGRLTKEALQRKRAEGARLGNRTNLREAQAKGSAKVAEEALRFAETVMPTIERLKASGITSLRGIAEALEQYGVPTARGGRWKAT